VSYANFHGLTSGCWDTGNLIGAALLHLNVAKVEDASHRTEEGQLLILVHSKNIHSILGETEGAGREGGEREGEKRETSHIHVHVLYYKIYAHYMYKAWPN
jgi:hypothetical protein